MKLLGLLRHSKSSWDEPSLADHDRPLGDRGRRNAKRMGRELAALDIRYDLALVSTARRAADSFDLLAGSWGLEMDRRSEPRIYEAAARDLLMIIAGAPAQVERLLLVGHNPAFHELALQLTRGDRSQQRLLLEAKMPTGALAEIRLPVASWEKVAEAKGELVRFLRPRDLD